MSFRSEAWFNALIGLVVAAVAALWWERFKTPVMFVVTLGILVAIHEWGHFIAAKSVGVKVYEFALGFGPRLTTYMRRGGTDYTIRLLPLGGFVNVKGMQPDDPITEDGLNGRRPAERALVYLAGPLMNMILGVVVLLFMAALFGVPDEKKVLVGNVVRKQPAERMQVVSVNGNPVQSHRPGLQVGDRILEVNGRPVTGFETVTGQIHQSAGRQVTMKVQRGDATLVLTGVPERKTITEPFVVVKSVPEGSALDLRPGDQLSLIDGKFFGTAKEAPDAAGERLLREQAGKPVTLTVWRDGTTPITLTGEAAPVDLEVREAQRTIGVFGFMPTPGQGPRVSVARSIEIGWMQIKGIFQQLFHMFSRPQQLGENLSGPIGIGAVLGQVGKLPLIYYFLVFAQLSLSLAIFNLLPIFVLDGGHMLLLTIEVLRRRRLDPEAQKTAMMVGMAIIGVLFVLIMSKDIMKHFG